MTIEVQRAAGLTAKRGELDGFAGAMTRLRGAYDAMQITWPVSSPPDVLTEAMQTGDRLSYHPELAQKEIAHFHEILRKRRLRSTNWWWMHRSAWTNWPNARLSTSQSVDIPVRKEETRRRIEPGRKTSRRT